jgi:DNA-binding NarL/FixJ family response regulator
LLVEDHAVLRDGLVRLINDESDLIVCGEAEDAQAAMAEVQATSPDVVIVDLRLKESNGLDLVRDLHTQYPDLPILVLSMYKESLYAERSLRAGAKGYIMKQEATDKVMTAIRRVLKGDIYVSETMATQMVQRIFGGSQPDAGPTLGDLTDREFEVFSLIGQGLGPTRIAEKMGVSVKTVETHREHIKEKLKLKNGTELTRMALQHAMGEEPQSGFGTAVSPRK